MNPSELELLASATSGDRDAMTQLLRHCAGPLRARVAANIDARWQAMLDVDDVLQVTYIEAFDGIQRLAVERVAAFQNWLYRLAENNIRDAIRHLDAAKRPSPGKRLTPTNENEACLDLVEALGVHSVTPSRVAAAKEARQLLQAALEDLPPDHQEVVRRFDLAQEDPKDIASSLGRSIGAVYMLRARAHDRLRRILPSISS
jgi:RNA polymerase sigma-70 factor, ECF subfamily